MLALVVAVARAAGPIGASGLQLLWAGAGYGVGLAVLVLAGLGSAGTVLLAMGDPGRAFPAPRAVDLGSISQS